MLNHFFDGAKAAALRACRPYFLGNPMTVDTDNGNHELAPAGGKKMKRLYQMGGVWAFLLLWNLAAPATASAQTGSAATTLEKDAVCTKKCHNETKPEPVLSMYQNRHGNRGDVRTPGCQDCHGPSAEHIKGDGASPDVVFKAGSKNLSPAAARNASCLACHEKNILPRSNWTGSQHERRGVACTDCHNNHSPDQNVRSHVTQSEVCFKCHKDKRAEVRRVSSHPLAVTGLSSPAKMACSDCHNPHGSTGPKLLIKNSVNETCYTCHPDRRGPFLWEHGPVVDDCTNCHTPHGSVNASLLKTRVPWLCQDCHSGDHAAAVNSGANLAGGNAITINGLQQPGLLNPKIQANARACLNCHSLVHGSNAPAGSKFQR